MATQHKSLMITKHRNSEQGNMSALSIDNEYKNKKSKGKTKETSRICIITKWNASHFSVCVSVFMLLVWA